jgi:hypothetical protein
MLLGLEMKWHEMWDKGIFLFKVIKRFLSAMLWVRICVNVDPDLDPAFYLSADPDADLDPGSPTNTNPCVSGLVRLKSHKKLNFYQKSVFKIGDLGQKLTFEGTEAVLKGRNQVNFGQFPCSWIRMRIRIPNTDLDSGSGKSKSIGTDPDRDPDP